MSILEGEIAAIVGEALQDAEIPYAMTLVRATAGTPDAETPWVELAGTQQSFACKGWIEDYSDRRIAAGVVKVGDRKIMLLATALTTAPQPGDVITYQGSNYTAVMARKDPAGALWEVQARP